MFEECPIALTPEYTTAEIDQPVDLYDGEMRITQGGNSWDGTGSIRFEWLPYSRVVLRFRPAEPNAQIKVEPCKLGIRLFDSDCEADVILTRVAFGFPSPSNQPVTGRVNNMNCGNNNACDHLRFHIPNLPMWLGSLVRTKNGGGALKRLSLQHDNWDIVIDAIKFGNQEYRELEDAGGHGLTHVGTISRRDRASFSLVDSEPMLECGSYFLSFCRGTWTFPILFSAEDAACGVIGRCWRSVLIDRYKHTISWVPSTQPVAEIIQTAFGGYADAWFSGLWGDALRTATQWYVEGSTGQAGKAIVLIQAALELFSWVRLVEEKKLLTKKDFGNNRENPFSKKLRILLNESSIPLSIPSSLSGLSAYSSACQLQDGPDAITSVRNALVHPSPKKRDRLKKHPRVLMDTWSLASWYLDLCMLNACGYKGLYANRTSPTPWAGDEVEKVPWAT